MSDEQEIFNDGVLKATVTPWGWVCIEWLTNKVGYLQKTCVRDFFKVERLIEKNGYRGWAMASELDNEGMHKIIEKVGGTPIKRDDEYVYFLKEFPCVEQLTQSAGASATSSLAASAKPI